MRQTQNVLVLHRQPSLSTTDHEVLELLAQAILRWKCKVDRFLLHVSIVYDLSILSICVSVCIYIYIYILVYIMHVL